MWAMYVGSRTVWSGEGYKNQSLGPEEGIFSRLLVENFSLDKGNGELILKNIKSANLNLPSIQFDCKESFNLGNFWKIAILG